MKTYFRGLSLFIYLGIMISCGNDEPSIEPVDLQKAQIEKLKGTWNSDKVVLDGFEITGFEDFELTVGNRTYNSKNGGEIWPLSGAWEFDGNSLTNVIRDDGVQITLKFLSDDEVLLSFQFDLVESGTRTNGINGFFEFSMAR